MAVAEVELQSPFLMAHAPTDGIGVAARATFLPPQCAYHSPGAAIVFDRRLCQGGVAESTILMGQHR